MDIGEAQLFRRDGDCKVPRPRVQTTAVLAGKQSAGQVYGTASLVGLPAFISVSLYGILG